MGMMVVPMAVAVVVMRVVLTQQPGADQIDDQADHGHKNRLAEADGNRAVEPHQAFPADQQRDQRQDHGAGKARQVPYLARAEGEAFIAGVAAVMATFATVLTALVAVITIVAIIVTIAVGGSPGRRAALRHRGRGGEGQRGGRG